MLYGPAHIVWCDENWESAQWCLDNFEKYTYDDDEAEHMAIVRQSLIDLLAVDDEFKSEPDEYKGDTQSCFRLHRIGKW